jgi:hypothetical protein
MVEQIVWAMVWKISSLSVMILGLVFFVLLVLAMKHEQTDG